LCHIISIYFNQRSKKPAETERQKNRKPSQEFFHLTSTHLSNHRIGFLQHRFTIDKNDTHRQGEIGYERIYKEGHQVNDQKRQQKVEQEMDPYRDQDVFAPVVEIGDQYRLADDPDQETSAINQQIAAGQPG
jgi:hypothetical protein